MAYSKITLEFIAVPDINETLSIGETSLGISLFETFKESRLATRQVSLPVFSPDDGIHPDRYFGFVNVNYKNAFNLDYNSTGLFTLTTLNGPINSGVGFVTIEANFSGAVFTGTSNAFVDVNIENEVVAPSFTIDTISFSQADANPCQQVKVNVTTSELATTILPPFTVYGNTENPFSFDWLRDQNNTLTVENALGVQTSIALNLPKFLNIANFNFDVVNSPDGGTLNISNVNSEGLILQYSLDNVTWQTSSVFSGLEVGNYTIYIKDQLGCSVSKGFSVTEFGVYTPYFYISKSNSIRFANRIVWGDSANYKTDENTLSHEVDCEIPYTEIQQFQSADVITTQFKSNYKNNVATIIKSDLSEVNVPVTKKSNNIGIKDKRDAFQYDLGNGKTGLYFRSGNSYDYVTGVVNGTYLLNGALPEWAVAGNYFKIGSSWFLIEDTFYDEAKNADVLSFSNVYTGADVAVIVAAMFKRFNYEVYEFDIDMVNYIDQYFQVRINNTDDNFTEIIHLSEMIWCKVKHENVLEIKYSNSSNTDIFYATGIENIIRLPYTYFKGKSDEDSEVHKTDTNSILLNADVYEVDEIVFEPVTKEIWRKMVLALSHENVTINGVGYVKNGNFNTEGPLERSNLYVLTATMIKTGSVYTSKSSGSLDFDGSAVEVPGLISTDTGFVSY
jgi:hypothetical protein